MSMNCNKSEGTRQQASTMFNQDYSNVALTDQKNDHNSKIVKSHVCVGGGGTTPRGESRIRNTIHVVHGGHLAVFVPEDKPDTMRVGHGIPTIQMFRLVYNGETSVTFSCAQG
jgi:hypothetical protein